MKPKSWWSGPAGSSGRALVLGDFGEWFESDFVSEGFELLDGFCLGFPGVVSGVVVGAGIAVEGAVDQHVARRR